MATFRQPPNKTQLLGPSKPCADTGQGLSIGCVVTAQAVVRMAAKALSDMAFRVYTLLIVVDTLQIRTLDCFRAGFGGGLLD